MNAAALLDRLAAAGIVVATDGDTLLLDAPAGSLTPAFLAELRDHKTLLLALLSDAHPTRDLSTPETLG